MRVGEPARQRAARRGVQPGQAQGHRERHQPLLRAVVQIALDPPPLRLEGVHQPGAGADQFTDPQLVAGRLDQQPGERGPAGRQRRQRVRQPGQQQQAADRQRGGHAQRVHLPDLQDVDLLAVHREQHRRGQQLAGDDQDEADRHQVHRPQHEAGERRVPELPPGRPLAVAQPQPGGQARAGRGAVRIRDRRLVDEPQQAPLQGGERHPGQRQRGQQRQPHQDDREHPRDNHADQQADPQQQPGQAAQQQVPGRPPGPGRARQPGAAQGLPGGARGHAAPLPSTDRAFSGHPRRPGRAAR